MASGEFIVNATGDPKYAKCNLEYCEEYIKCDISDRLVNYPAVSITSNKITSLTKDLSKRAIICRIGAKIDNERGAKNSKRVNESMSELTTAFYGEYVRRMLVCIDEMTTEMRENANGKEYFPDIFHASSSVIADIFEACGIDLPDYVRILYYNDYMGDESIGRAAIEKSNWHGRQTRASSGLIRSRTGSFTPIRRMDRGTN